MIKHIYSNGAEAHTTQVWGMTGGVKGGVDVDYTRSFYGHETGFLDAPNCIAGGSTKQNEYNRTIFAIGSVVARPS